MATAEELIQRFDRLTSDRAEFDERWQKIRAYQRPGAAPFFGSDEGRGHENRGLVYDNTAEEAADMAAAGIGGLLTGQSIDWHTWEWQDDDLKDDHDAKAWLADCSRRQLEVYRRPDCRFGTTMDAVYLDLIDFSNACLFVRGRGERLPPLFLPRRIQDTYWAVDDDETIDTVFWRFKLTARQAAKRWGMGKLPEKLAECAKDPKRADDTFDFLHVVTPASDPWGSGTRARPMPYDSCYLALDEKHKLEVGGYNAMPYFPFRWRTRAGERYGRGPSDKALPDVAVLQEMDAMSLEALSIAVRPTLMAPDDGVIGGVTQESSEIITVRSDLLFRPGGDPVRPVQTGVRPDISEEAAEGRRHRIRRAFLQEMLQIMRDPRATATQVLEVREEQFRSAAPIVNGLEAESLGPMAVYVFDIMLRGKHFAAAPANVAGREFRAVFQSPIARAQRLAHVRGFSQLVDIATGIATATGDPTVFDMMDMGTALRASAEALAVPFDFIRSPEEVAQMEAERKEMQREMHEREQALDESTMLKNATPALTAVMNANDEAAA